MITQGLSRVYIHVIYLEGTHGLTTSWWAKSSLKTAKTKHKCGCDAGLYDHMSVFKQFVSILGNAWWSQEMSLFHCFM